MELRTKYSKLSQTPPGPGALQVVSRAQTKSVALRRMEFPGESLTTKYGL